MPCSHGSNNVCAHSTAHEPRSFRMKDLRATLDDDAWVKVLERSTRTPKTKSLSSPGDPTAASFVELRALRREPDDGATGDFDTDEERRDGGDPAAADEERELDFFLAGVGDTVFFLCAEALRFFC